MSTTYRITISTNNNLVIYNCQYASCQNSLFVNPDFHPGSPLLLPPQPPHSLATSLLSPPISLCPTLNTGTPQPSPATTYGLWSGEDHAKPRCTQLNPGHHARREAPTWTSTPTPY